MTFSDTANMFVDLKFNLLLEWFDHQATWTHLQPDSHLNVLSPEELDRLWLPKVLFRNSDNISPIHHDGSSVVSVRKEGPGVSLQGALYYNASENPLVYQRKYQQRFYCNFDFHWYPFDTQECGIELVNFDALKVSEYGGPLLART
jgi:hypothetical protein